MITDFASAIIAVTSSLWKLVTRHVCYFVGFEDNINSLRNAMSELIAARDDVQRRVAVAEGQALTSTHQVKEWLQKVEAIQGEMEAIEQGFQQQKYLKICGTNCSWSYSLGKRAAKKLIDVNGLKINGVFGEVVGRSLPNPVNEIPYTSSVGNKITLERVLGYLREDDVGIIGIFGMGGVGKTTLLRKINNKFLSSTHDLEFDVIIWVLVSRDLNVGRIQKAIGDRLGLSWQEDQSQEARAMDIFRILRRKKFLLLLDDVWKKLDRHEVGIPRPDSKNKCKIVFTTRSMEICSDMDSQENVKVECLEDEEAWELFRDRVGREGAIDSPTIQPLAEAIFRKCGGLPLALITIGRAMANKETVEEWTDAIRVLNKSSSEIRGMEENVFPLLKFSYDNLHNDTVRLCFLHCSLFPEDYSIEKEQLIEYWIGEGFFDELEDSDEAHNYGHALIGSLKVACLLESGDEVTQVKMHDVIRAMALWIANERGEKKNKFLVQASIGLTKAPRIEKWKEAERISLMDNEISALIEIPKCPNLFTLMLQYNIGLNRVSNGFFQYMPTLRVLDLSFTGLEELPVGIGELVELHHLDLSRTKITTLPKELGGLAKLKHLDLQRTHFLRTIPREVISKLSQLRVLNLYYSYGDWEVEGCEDGSGVTFAELEHLNLRHLTTLGITITKVVIISRMSCLRNFSKCVRYLYIKECEGLKTFQFSSNFGNMKRLRRLSINNCYELEEVIIGEEEREDWLSNLQTLSLYGLPNLKTIWGRIVTRGCLQNLRYINIVHCHMLKNVTWVSLLQNLEVIYVFYCMSIEELIGEDEVVDELFRFPKLKTISLGNLPELKIICRHAVAFPSLERITVIECPKLKMLPLDSHNAKNLETIYGDRDWWDELEWDEEYTKCAFVPHFTAI